MTGRGVVVASPIAIVISVAALLFGIGGAAAQISGGDLPGRGRERFIDPPGAELLQPRERNTILPWEQRPSGYDCRAGKRKGAPAQALLRFSIDNGTPSQHAKARCRPAR